MTLQNYIDATITVSFWLDDGNGGNSNGNRRLKDHPIAPDETYEITSWHYLGVDSVVRAQGSTVSCLAVQIYGVELIP